MDTNLRIMMVGKLQGSDFEYHIAPPPQTDEPQMVSSYMRRIMALGHPTELFWDGFYAECEGKPLAAMPTEQQERGWWAARIPRSEQMLLSDLEEARLDEEYHRSGGW